MPSSLPLLVQYHDVQNVILSRMNKLSRKHYTDKVSVKLWMQYLKKQKNCFTLYELRISSGPFLVSWMSPWQVKLLKNAQEWSLDSTHKICISFQNNHDDAYLFTIVVRSQITNKGVPVCFFITDRENQPVFVQWLNWIISVVAELSVKNFLVDCSVTEISAIKEVLRLYFTMSLTYQTSLRKKKWKPK